MKADACECSRPGCADVIWREAHEALSSYSATTRKSDDVLGLLQGIEQCKDALKAQSTQRQPKAEPNPLGKAVPQVAHEFEAAAGQLLASGTLTADEARLVEILSKNVKEQARVTEGDDEQYARAIIPLLREACLTSIALGKRESHVFRTQLAGAKSALAWWSALNQLRYGGVEAQTPMEAKLLAEMKEAKDLGLRLSLALVTSFEFEADAAYHRATTLAVLQGLNGVALLRLIHRCVVLNPAHKSCVTWYNGYASSLGKLPKDLPGRFSIENDR